MSDLSRLANDWDDAARTDAFGNIMTVPGMTPEEFWESGEREIAALDVSGERVLDFGCGVGRLTRPLADHFTEAVGVDISREMIRLAESFDERPLYYVSLISHLPFSDDSFDLVYSSIVLQHMPPELQRRYVREFLRILSPEGAALFQLPEGPTDEAGALSMYGTDRSVVEGWIAEAGGTLQDVATNNAAGQGFTSYVYRVAK